MLAVHLRPLRRTGEPGVRRRRIYCRKKMKNLARKKIAGTLILILFMGCSGSLSIGSAQRKSTQVETVDVPKVGVIEKSKIVNGCAFGFYYPSEKKKDDPRYVFFDDFSNLAWM